MLKVHIHATLSHFAMNNINIENTSIFLQIFQIISNNSYANLLEK